MRIVAFFVFAFSLILSSFATAQEAPPLDVAAKQAFLLDAATGTVLFAKDADTRMPTSSMSKIMTMYVVFDALKAGKLKLDQVLPVSEHAWKQEGSRMFVNVGAQVKVEDLIRGVIVQSGNDASVVLAEALGSGSESAFAQIMNAKAAELGLKDSHFMNATGLPDEQHYSTARDLTTLATAIMRDFPEHYHYFAEVDFTFNGISQGNRNPLLYRNMNVDGLKTGHTEAGGFGLTGSAVREGRRMVFVLNGMQDMQARADESAKLLDYGYREFGLYPVVRAGDILANPPVWLGTSSHVQIMAPQDLLVTLPRAARSALKAAATFDQPIPAPIQKGQKVGELTVSAPGMETKVLPLVASADVDQVGFFSRLFQKIGLMFRKG